MALRCGCPAEGDEIVFGPVHECSVKPRPPADLPRLVPSWRFVVPEASEGVYDPDLQEARIHQTLGEDELHD